MGVRLADIIGVLDAAYPPALAESWDSVGLVCGDPDQQIDTVTVAVDATAAVVDEMDGPGAHLLLAHHPLLLRGVDTVAASTPKGALVHRLIRAGGALFTAHTNADSASPGVSDALAQALGLTVTSVLAPRFTDYDKWVVFVPTESVHAVRRAMFEAGAGHIGAYSDCSWSVTGTGQFRPLAGSDPAVGSTVWWNRSSRTAWRWLPRRGCVASCSRRFRPPTPTRFRPSTCCPWRRRRPAPAWGG